MRDFSNDWSSLALNTATLGHNMEGRGAEWSVERVIDACAVRGFGAITYWRREIGSRAQAISTLTRYAAFEVAGLLCLP